ncbi:tRNA-dihydrouridine(47) synthase [NAD(P)(+)]-like protein [Obelidium mucronatum]|nr:tRNA-dihydrouridine(47) synthase [NAD(P)(+)]-like protein [Obelidium mucronatum]
MTDNGQRNQAPVKPEFHFPDPKAADYRHHHTSDPQYLLAQQRFASLESESKVLEPNLNPAEDTEKEVDFEAAEKDVSSKKRNNRNERTGQNKKRKEFNKTGNDSMSFCAAFGSGQCNYENCKYSHDVDLYVASKGKDISGECVLFREYGVCKFGVRCRFADAHSFVDSDGVKKYTLVDQVKVDAVGSSKENLNKVIKKDLDLYKRARGKKDSDAVEEVKAWVEKEKQYNNYRAQFATEATRVMKESLSTVPPTATESVPEKATEEGDDDFYTLQLNKALKYLPEDKVSEYHEKTRNNQQLDQEFLSKCRDKDRKSFEWKGTYLAPLTNVGHLPFRRVAKDFGVDITCAEMMMVNNLTNYTASEWALVRRHPSETKFGIQISANQGVAAARAGDALNSLLFENPTNRHADLAPFDFIDINCGCPIDMVFKSGAGSALMGRRNRLRDIIYGLRRTLPVPISVKLRTGINDNANTAHKLIPSVVEWGASAVTLHGRSRQQRYTKTANWEYINECGKIAKASGIPFYGNGDCFGFEDYYREMPTLTGDASAGGFVNGVMVGRGALIKPWIFEEIKEQKVWDISGRERFDIFKKFADYGLEHWGSDTKGVNLTRTYMLDWMSFTHRYIPVGLLERLPQKFNDRPPAFFGRDYYETLLASWKVSDWIHATELILGKAPADFHFIPKHKSNSYEDDGVDESIHG